jgi:hypothetical protein
VSIGLPLGENGGGLLQGRRISWILYYPDKIGPWAVFQFCHWPWCAIKLGTMWGQQSLSGSLCWLPRPALKRLNILRLHGRSWWVDMCYSSHINCLLPLLVGWLEFHHWCHCLRFWGQWSSHYQWFWHTRVNFWGPSTLRGLSSCLERPRSQCCGSKLCISPSEVALCPLLPRYCVKPSWNVWFRDYQYVFYLEKVIFHLGKFYLNLISPSF